MTQKLNFFTTDTLLISVNSLRILGSEMLQKNVYRENFAMTQLRMIPEPYLTQTISMKVKGLRSCNFNPMYLDPSTKYPPSRSSETLYKKSYSENSKLFQM
jgi:hypothetical protein